MSKCFIRLMVVMVSLIVADAAWAQTHKLRVDDPAETKALIDRGGRLIADYGSFQVVESAEVPTSGKESAHVQVEDRYDVIDLNTGPLNTRTPEVKALRKSAGSFSGKRLHLVQFVGPIKPEWVDELEKNGGHIVSYIPNNAYLIYADSPSLAQMQTWAAGVDYVQWDGSFEDSYKIHPRARFTNELGQLQNPTTDTFAIQLVDDDAANAATLGVIDRLSLAPVISDYRILNYRDIIVRLPPGLITVLATQPEVVSIQPYEQRHKLDERQDQIIAGNLIGNAPSSPGYLDWLASKGFTQQQFIDSGFVVDVSDSGIDNGTTSPGHYALYQFGNPTMGTRVVYNRLEGSPHGGSTLQGCDGHGNLNAHIIAGFSDLAIGSIHTDSAGYRYDLGVCPFVKVGSSVIFDPDLFTNPNYSKLQGDAYTSGARISANSWGSDVAGAYDTDAQTYDALVRNASQSFVGTNRQMVIVFAAGNAGSGAKTIDSPGSAKNVITVGASENVRSMNTSNGGSSFNGSDGCSTSDTSASSANDMATFSSRGPTADGRMKPDLVAPGTHITGGAPQSGSATTNGTGSALACFDASGVCALPGSGSVGSANNFFPLGQQFYTASSGTSHSTPSVAGACALLRQYFINNGFAPPSPAMTKADLINSARYLTGSGANDDLWSPNQGMGGLDLGMTFDGVPRILRDQLSADTFTSTGPTRVFTGVISDPSKPFRVTLAWTDAPGSLAAGTELMNNLDLTVIAGGNVYRGNNFSGSLSVTGGSADVKNNVESVFLPAGLTGSFEVQVNAANITSDGIPNVSPSVDQDFALVIYNAMQTNVPVIVLSNATLTAEGCFPTNGVIDPGETVTLSFGLKNIGLANTTNLVGKLLATNGVTLPSGPQIYGALSTNGGTVSMPFSFTAFGECGGSVTAMLQLQDGNTDLGVIAFSFTLGLVPVFSENFDGVTPPTLPAGWTSSASGGQIVWVTSVASSDSSPNSVYSRDATSTGSSTLNSVSIDLPSGPTTLSFRNKYDLEASGSVPSRAYDGGVLEIKIGGGAFTDILAAGGSFAAGGYNRTVSSSFGNPLAGRQCWSGSSGGFITTTVNLPPAASGQTVQFRWICGTDSSAGKTGWYVDSLVISGLACCTGTLEMADLAIGNSPAQPIVNVSSNVTFVVNVTNLGPNAASSVVVTDSIPSALTFTTATVSQGTWTNNGNVFSASLGTLSNGASATMLIQALANVGGLHTNTTLVSSSTADPNSVNNTSASILSINTFPTLTGITNVITAEDIAAGPIGFTIGDAETPAGSLIVSAASSNTNLANPADFIIGRSGSNLDITMPPVANQNGSCMITITVSDGMASTNTSFTLTVTPVNDPPALEAIPDHTVIELTQLLITTKAGDIDLPPQMLTFSMANAPSNSVINPTNGIFAWTPTEAQGPSTFSNVAVIVTDDGVPPLSATQYFTIFVLETNSAPMLSHINDFTVHAGMLVTYTNVATDTDIPTNLLTFSLDPGFPAGATINSSNGIFQWQTTDMNANTTNLLIARVTDDGLPPRSDAINFSITVVPRPFLEFVSLSDQKATIRWSSIPGVTYRVFGTGNLITGNWTNLAPDVTAVGASSTATNSVGDAPYMFYRVAPLP